MLFGAKSELHGEISLKTFVRVDKTVHGRIMQQIKQIQQTDKRYTVDLFTQPFHLCCHIVI